MSAFSGLVHLHSTYSRDGSLSLAEIRGRMKAGGYRFALMAEHAEDLDGKTLANFIAECRALSDADALLIPGVEFHDRCVATCGLTRPVRFDGDEAERLAACLAEDTFNVLVHPSGARPMPAAGGGLDRVHAVEVWNVKADGGRYPSLKRIAAWKRLRRTRDVHPIVAIDLHDARQFISLTVEVEADELTADAVLTAMKAGRYRLRRGDRTWDVDRLPLMLRTKMRANALVRAVAAGLRKALGRVVPKRLRRSVKALIDGGRHE